MGNGSCCVSPSTSPLLHGHQVRVGAGDPGRAARSIVDEKGRTFAVWAPLGANICPKTPAGPTWSVSGPCRTRCSAGCPSIRAGIDKYCLWHPFRNCFYENKVFYHKSIIITNTNLAMAQGRAARELLGSPRSFLLSAASLSSTPILPELLLNSC